MKITNSEGEEVEVFTQEELDSKINEAKEGMTPSDEITSLKEELKALKEKDLNFKNLRKQKEDSEKTAEQRIFEKEAALEEFKKKHDEDMISLRKEIRTKELKEEISKMSNDEEEQGKIKYYFDKLSQGEEESKHAEILLDAYKIVTGSSVLPNFTSASRAGGGNAPKEKSESEQWISDAFSITRQFNQDNK